MGMWLVINASWATRLAGLGLVSIILSAWLGPWLSPHDVEAMNWDALGQGPSWQHWFGTDDVGRDLFVRTMSGAQVSLSIALLTTLVALAIGVPWGAIAGLSGGQLDQAMMRIVDGIYCLPGILVVILLVVMFGQNQYLIFAGLGAISWLDIARIVRAQTLQLRASPFIEASRAMGAPTYWLLWRHVMPNVIGPIVVYTTLLIPGVILAESFISFLGLGIQEPETSWGVLVADGARQMESAPGLLLFPAACLAITVWSLNILGDRLRDRLDGEDVRQSTARS